MIQTSIFEDSHLERVKSNIGQRVLLFITAVGVGHRFHAADLCQFVWASEICAPESPGRIMRQLRLQEYFDYRVIDRSKALYEVTEIHYGKTN